MAPSYRTDRDTIRRIVLTNPIPERLISDLRRAPLVSRPGRHRWKRMRLTPALYEALKLMAKGESNAQIADHLGIGFWAAQERTRRLLAYFDVPNRTALVAKCYRERIF